MEGIQEGSFVKLDFVKLDFVKSMAKHNHSFRKGNYDLYIM